MTDEVDSTRIDGPHWGLGRMLGSPDGSLLALQAFAQAKRAEGLLIDSVTLEVVARGKLGKGVGFDFDGELVVAGDKTIGRFRRDGKKLKKVGSAKLGIPADSLALASDGAVFGGFNGQAGPKRMGTMLRGLTPDGESRFKIEIGYVTGLAVTPTGVLLVSHRGGLKTHDAESGELIEALSLEPFERGWDTVERTPGQPVFTEEGVAYVGCNNGTLLRVTLQPLSVEEIPLATLEEPLGASLDVSAGGGRLAITVRTESAPVIISVVAPDGREVRRIETNIVGKRRVPCALHPDGSAVFYGTTSDEGTVLTRTRL